MHLQHPHHVHTYDVIQQRRLLFSGQEEMVKQLPHIDTLMDDVSTRRLLGEHDMRLVDML